MRGQVAAFINYIQVERGLSANTVAAYRSDLEKFARFAERGTLVWQKIRREQVVDFLGQLYKQGLDSRSVARVLVTLRNFFRFLLEDASV